MLNIKMLHSLSAQRFEYLVHSKEMPTEAKLEAALELISFFTDLIEFKINTENNLQLDKKN